MIAADSNVLLRLLLGDVPQQADKALQWLREQPEGSVIIPDAVLVEVLFLLESKRAYGLPRKDFMPPLRQLLCSTPWRVAPLTMSALDLFNRTKLDYVDCLLAVMRDAGVVSEIATFDKDLQRATGHAAL